ncbi:MAG: hypothetical protein P8Z35_05245 [Ignavibacteriaceae bacterium]
MKFIIIISALILFTFNTITAQTRTSEVKVIVNEKTTQLISPQFHYQKVMI